MKKTIRRVAFMVKPVLEKMIQLECSLAKKWVESAHKRLMKVQWILPPQPEHFDHHIDLYYQFLAQRNSLWLERGVFGSLALKGGTVLELACGDGFNARNFYSLRSKHIIACDFDSTAIRVAQQKNAASNILYVLADIRTQMPQGTFENIVWDAAIAHFTPDEITRLLNDIKDRLAPSGILSGYTIVEKADKTKLLSHHEYEFKDKNDLVRFLKPYFSYVTVFETIFPDRHNLYFWASQENVLPFSKNWHSAIHYQAD